MVFTKEQLLARLQELQIGFSQHEYPAVSTVETQAKYAHSKNLFLKDKKNRFYIVSAFADTKVDLEVLSQGIGLGKGGLIMALDEEVSEILQVTLDCVTPFAVVNESARFVTVLLDKGFDKEYCFFHPLSSDMYVGLNAKGLDTFLNSIGNFPAYVDFEAIEGENQPLLASLIRSDDAELQLREFFSSMTSCFKKENDIRSLCINPVADQEDANICYAFVMNDVLFADHYLAKGFGYNASKQDIMDHLHLMYAPPPDPGVYDEDDKVIYNVNGIGNTVENIFEFVKEIGVLLESDYTYKGLMSENRTWSDREDLALGKPTISMESAGMIDDWDHDKCFDKLNSVPLTGVVMAHRSFMMFTGIGVYEGPSKNEQHVYEDEDDVGPHAITVIGQGVERVQILEQKKGKRRKTLKEVRYRDVPYYTVKNSHGEDWALYGYGKIAVDLFKDSVYHYYPIRTHLKTWSGEGSNLGTKEGEEKKNVEGGEI